MSGASSRLATSDGQGGGANRGPPTKRMRGDKFSEARALVEEHRCPGASVMLDCVRELETRASESAEEAMTWKRKTTDDRKANDENLKIIEARTVELADARKKLEAEGLTSVQYKQQVDKLL